MTLKSATMMAELFQKSLGIREDGHCYRHPDVLLLEQGACCLGLCQYCSMEKQKELRDDTTTTAMSNNSFFWSSAASLSLTSSFRQQQQNQATHGGSSSNEEQPTSSASQATGEGNAEKLMQQRFFESLVARWVQIQDGNLQQSIALSTPLILNELRKLEAKVDLQETIIQKQENTIDELRQTIEAKHAQTQEMLDAILNKVTSAAVHNEQKDQAKSKAASADGPVDLDLDSSYDHSKKKLRQGTTTSTTNVEEEHGEGEMELESLIKQAPPSKRKVPSKRLNNSRKVSTTSSVRSNARSVDSSVQRPITRHDSNRSFGIQDISNAKKPSSAAAAAKKKKIQKDLNRSQPIAFTEPLPAEVLEKMSASQREMRDNSEIALDGSRRSSEEWDLPDFEEGMGAIFEEGIGEDLASIKKKKFQIPPTYGKLQQQQQQQQRNHQPMEIILESAETRQSERKLIPTSPEEMGMELGDSLRGNAAVFVAGTTPKTSRSAPAASRAVPPTPAESEEPDVHVSCVTLDAASAASELSDSDSEDEGDDDEGSMDSNAYGDEGAVDKTAASWVDDGDDDDGNEYNLEELQHVSRYKMIDMYGDRGTYTGTLGPDNDPTGFGTMKYDSGRFFKGEWKKGRWNGKGTLLNANGDSYQGDFVSDARHGRGVYRFTSGDVYEGEFVDDNRHGKGKFKFHNGSVYTGDFCMGSFEGFGRYDFDGGFYEGQWKRDEYYGQGKLQYKDGSNYTGRFKRGSAHGFGVERLADGTVRCGLWRRGEFLQECTEEECRVLEAKTSRKK